MDKHETRRLKLRALIDAMYDGNVAAFGRAVGLPPGYANRMLYEPDREGAKRIGEDMISKIVAAIPGIDAGYFDQARVPGTVGDAQVEQLVQDYEALPAGWQHYLRHKASQLRQVADGLPPFLKSSMQQIPPDSSYWEWERKLEEFLHEQKDKEA